MSVQTQRDETMTMGPNGRGHLSRFTGLKHARIDAFLDAVDQKLKRAIDALLVGFRNADPSQEIRGGHEHHPIEMGLLTGKDQILTARPAEPFEGCVALEPAPQRLGEMLEALDADRDDQLLLVGEVAVERSRGQIQARRELPHRETAETLVDDQARALAEDAFSGGGFSGEQVVNSVNNEALLVNALLARPGQLVEMTPEDSPSEYPAPGRSMNSAPGEPPAPKKADDNRTQGSCLATTPLLSVY